MPRFAVVDLTDLTLRELPYICHVLESHVVVFDLKGYHYPCWPVYPAVSELRKVTERHGMHGDITGTSLGPDVPPISTFCPHILAICAP